MTIQTLQQIELSQSLEQQQHDHQPLRIDSKCHSQQNPMNINIGVAVGSQNSSNVLQDAEEDTTIWLRDSLNQHFRDWKKAEKTLQLQMRSIDSSTKKPSSFSNNQY